MRVALIVNPGARGALQREAVAAELRRHGAEVLDPGDPRAERIVVAGGDGSVGPAAAEAARRGIPLAVVPAGTGNDFARRLELPRALPEACRVAARGLTTVTLELGWMGSRPFVNLASAGLAPVAARRARGLKARLGGLAYAVGAARAGLTAQPVACRVTVDGAALHAGRAWQAMVAVSGAFGAGAGIDAADPSDGRLDVVIVPAGPRAALLAHAAALRSGRIAERAGIPHARGREVEVALNETADLNVDGELVRVSVARFGVQAAAYELVTAR